jgi:hypothetical protein
MSCASRRVSITFIRGCGSSNENARLSGLGANFRAITSNGGASVTSLRWPGVTIWHVTHRVSATRLPLSTSAASAIDATQIPVTSEQKRSGCTDPSIKHLQRRPRLRQEPAHASCAASTHEIHAFLIQIKIQLARPPSLTRMEAIFDLQTTLEKFGSWLRKRVPGLRRDLAPRRRRRTGHSAHRAATARGRGGCGQRGLDAAHSQRTAKSERQGASQEVTRDDFIGLLKGTAHWS